VSAKVSVRYNGSDEALELPDSWRVLGIGNPGAVEPLADVGVAVTKALAAPVGMSSLRSGFAGVRKVVIAVDDQTRPTPAAQVIAALLPDLRAMGIADANVTIVVAKGTHAWPTDQQVRAKVGAAASGCRTIVHDPDDESGLTLMGTTTRGTPVWINRAVAEADLFIGVGAVVTHYMAGYGGGPKLVLPGVAGRKSIMANHTIARSREAAQARTAGNPLYEDMLEAALIAKLAMKIDVVLDMNNQPVDVVAGAVAAGHQAAIASYNRLFGFPVPVKADVTITSGFPLEIELLQSCKAVLSADLATKDGGAIILFSACTNGVGPGFGEAMRKKPQPAEVWDWVGDGRTTPTGGPMVARVLDVLQTKRVVVVTPKLSADEVRAMGFEYAASGAEALALVASEMPNAGVLVFPSGAAINPLP
jgi:lactate racemase